MADRENIGVLGLTAPNTTQHYLPNPIKKKNQRLHIYLGAPGALLYSPFHHLSLDRQLSRAPWTAEALATKAAPVSKAPTALVHTPER